jgi:hypothetical protein
MSSSSHRGVAVGAVDVQDLLDPELREVFGAFELPQFDAEPVNRRFRCGYTVPPESTARYPASSASMAAGT